ncbi:isochorismatase family cysteine hydrolase [Burkholderia sp. Ac-20365]|uniref:cysteine hydrolase family protein n=1 Tax=Burkholderia sp. Ac-20365 TaxID=2703897 RepID=UPI00197C528F|nr:isochorismatase family cysteine hydrolase [Burkholderia sp. Ac-20365]
MTSGTQLDPRQTALIIVDLQNDFVSEGGAYDRGGAASDAARALPLRVAPVARVLKQRGGFVAASQFTLWPDAQGEPMISPHLRQLRPFLRRGDFVAGSNGHATVAALHDLVDVSVWKVAYSAFFNTQLDWVLRRAGIETVAICGIVTNGGVASTARDAHMRDYRVLVLADGCAASMQAAHDAALADLCTVGEVTTCEAFQARLGA